MQIGLLDMVKHNEMEGQKNSSRAQGQGHNYVSEVRLRLQTDSKLLK